MAIKLPPKVMAAIKRVPPAGWVVVAGVVLAVLYLKTHKGTGASASAGLSGGSGAGSGGDTFAGTPGVPVIPVTPVVPLNPSNPGVGGSLGSFDPFAGLNLGGLPAGTNPTPGGTVTPNAGLPGAFGLPTTQVVGAGSPTNWGQPIDLSGPSADTYTLAQQYYYAINHPGLPGASRSTLFTKDPSVMLSQLQQLLMSVGSSVGTQDHPTFESGYASGGQAYPDIPKAVYQFAGVAKEQFSPTSFYGSQVVAQGYPLNFDPNIPGANEHPGVQIPYLQAEIAQGMDTATGQRLSATQITALRQQLAALQASYASQVGTLSGVIPATFGGTPAASGYGGSPTISAGGTVDTGTAARMAALQAAIATQAKNVTTYTNLATLTSAQKAALATDQASLTKYQTELAGLQPTRAF
jgi:hypothetical protein